MFRKGPRPFYKISGDVGLFSTSAPPEEYRIGTQAVEEAPEPAPGFSERLLQTRTSQSESGPPIAKPLAPPPSQETRENFKRPRKSKTLFVDSAFFSAGDHPTWEQQVAMARRIASSLSDAANRHSRGQSMYEKRQKRSPRWVHQGGVPLTSEDYKGPILTEQTKPLLDLVMNPQGQLLDLESLRDKGVVISTESLSPELCSELIRDLHTANGRGGQLFARRRKRAERWVVDESHPEPCRPGERPTTQLPRPRPSRAEPETLLETRPETRHETGQEARPEAPHEPLTGMSVTIPAMHLEDLWQPSQTARFPTGGVYSPRTPQGWRSPAAGQVPLTTVPAFPEHVEPPLADTVPDLVSPTAGTVPDMEPTDTWDWSAQQRQRQQPAPSATLFESPLESLRAMEERRRQGQSIYTPQAWSDGGAHRQHPIFPVT